MTLRFTSAELVQLQRLADGWGVKVGEAGKLYGSITAKDIADALGRRGIVVDRHKVDLDEPLKSLGTYKVAVKVFSGMAPEVTVVVEPKG